MAAVSVRAYIQPSMLQWAIERGGLPLALLAKKLGVAEEKVRAWLAGEARPTLRQARLLAQKLHVPFGYLFLDSPPDERIPIPDLRTVPGAHRRPFSPEFLDVLHDALRKQEWLRAWRAQQGAVPLSFVGRFSERHDPARIAADMAKALGVNGGLRRTARSWEGFLGLLVERAEECGVIVLRSGVVGANTHRSLDVAEFRGFVLTDPYAPIVFLNGKDAKAAQTFTLAHELAHLWIGQSGVVSPDMGATNVIHSPRVERFCNQVAAELLVPRHELEAYWNPALALAKNTDGCTKAFRVSKLVVLRRAYDVGLLPRTEFEEAYREELRRSIERSSKARGGGDGRNNIIYRNSPTFTREVLTAALERRILLRDAAHLLGVRSIPSMLRTANALGLT